MKNKKEKRAMIIILMTVTATIILMNVTLLLSVTIIWIVHDETNDDDNDDDDGDQFNNDGANFGKLLFDLKTKRHICQVNNFVFVLSNYISKCFQLLIFFSFLLKCFNFYFSL